MRTFLEIMGAMMGRVNRQLSDEELVLLGCAGDSLAVAELVARYLPMIRHKASGYRLPGLESEDVVQEGLLGLLKAIRLFERGKSSFGYFAALCVSSSMATAAKTAFSLKSKPLLDYSSLDSVTAFSAVPGSDPAQEMILREQTAELSGKIKTLLSPLEQQALELYLSGHSYVEISQLLYTTSKAVDNALQRVKRKLRSSEKTTTPSLYHTDIVR